jgi:DNA-binding LacI/PurR family transcriptional regulator
MAERADGLILCAPRMSGTHVRAIAAKTTVVLANRLSRTVPSIWLDFGPGIAQALAHLQALGHRRIAFLAGPRDSWSNRQRRKFLTAGCAERGIELVELGPYEPKFEGGYRAADEALATGVTAVFAYNDLVALGVLSRLHARGVRVPEELSIVGCDDVPTASMVQPPLTTVDVPIPALARAASAMLLAELRESHPNGAGGTPPSRPPAPELETRLLIRSTTGPPP